MSHIIRYMYTSEFSRVEAMGVWTNGEIRRDGISRKEVKRTYARAIPWTQGLLTNWKYSAHAGMRSWVINYISQRELHQPRKQQNLRTFSTSNNPVVVYLFTLTQSFSLSALLEREHKVKSILYATYLRKRSPYINAHIAHVCSGQKNCNGGSRMWDSRTHLLLQTADEPQNREENSRNVYRR